MFNIIYYIFVYFHKYFIFELLNKYNRSIIITVYKFCLYIPLGIIVCIVVVKYKTKYKIMETYIIFKIIILF